MDVRCTSCGEVLQVIEQAAGQQQLCPACGRDVDVPDAQALLDETIADWLLEDAAQGEQIKRRHASIYAQLTSRSRDLDT